MINIDIATNSVQGFGREIQSVLGGKFEEKWGEQVLILDNDFAKGQIKFLDFDWGVNLIEFNIVFKQDILLTAKTSGYNPIHFIFCSKGNYSQGFDSPENLEAIEPFQSVIIANKKGGDNLMFFPKNVHQELNVIQILKRKFLKKRLNGISLINKELYEVFIDTNHKDRYEYFGSLNLKMSDHVKSLRNLQSKGMTRMLQIEAKIYIILSLHIQQHNLANKETKKAAPLKKSELKLVRKVAKSIIKNPSYPYTLKELSLDSTLSQAKLQEGFKYLFNRTVTDFIRYTRLKSARELMNTTDLNISEIVYSIGFTSRSYFSKIFREQYNVSPTEYKKHVTQPYVA